MIFDLLFWVVLAAPIGLGAALAFGGEEADFGIGAKSFTAVFIPHAIYWFIMLLFYMGTANVYRSDSAFQVSKADAEKNLTEYRKMYNEGKDNKILTEALGAKIAETKSYLSEMQKHEEQKIKAKKDAEEFRKKFPLGAIKLFFLAVSQFVILFLLIPSIHFFVKTEKELREKEELAKKEALPLDKVDPFAPFWEVGDLVTWKGENGLFAFLSAEHNKVWLEREKDKKIFCIPAYKITGNVTFENNRKADLLKKMGSESEYMLKLTELKNLINLREVT